MEQGFLDLQGNLKGLKRVLVLPVLFVNTGKVVECEGTQLEQFFWRPYVVPHVLVEQHVDTFWNQVQFLLKVHLLQRRGHDLDVYLVDELCQLRQEF